MPRPGPMGGTRREGCGIFPGVVSGPGGGVGWGGGYWSLFDNLD